MNKQTRRRWLNRFIFVFVVGGIIAGYLFYINSATIYDFSHLTRTMDFGEGRRFEPLTEVGEGRVPEMVRAAETPYIALYLNTQDTTFAIYDKRNGNVWHSSPQGPEAVANAYNRGVMRSNMGFSYYDHQRRRQHRWLYNDSAQHGPEQFTIYSINGGGRTGVRIAYTVGDLDLGLHVLPRYLCVDVFQEMHDAILEDDPSDARFFRLQWLEVEDEEAEGFRPGFRWLSPGAFDNPINITRMLRIFNEKFEWTIEQTVEMNELSGYESEVSFDFFHIVYEIMLERDRMFVNVPLAEIRFTGEDLLQVFSVDILRFFGAGCVESEGFMLVPSGAGGIITFNNGKYREFPFSSAVYGTDPLMTSFFPQVEQSVRLPVIGINNNGFGLVAHVYNGAALATVNAEVAAETAGVGATTAQNNAWFNFHLRSSMPLGMGGIPGAGGDLRVVQEFMYTGDLTVIYQFLPDANPGVGEMAQAYQQFLVEQGVLTPLSGPGDRSFYLDLLGAIDVQRHILGTPYMTLEVMTDMDDAHRFVDILNAGGVSTIQMQLHGWFNRGVNHDVAKRVRPISDVGSPQELNNMNTRLAVNGGGLHPAVNFHLTNYYSRNFSRPLESARDPAGYIGFKSRVARDMLFTRFNIHRNDWFVLVHPGVIPQHIDSFIPSFENRVGLNGLALVDMGDILTESIHRRNPVDREHSRLITMEQMGRLQDSFPNLVVFGGNDYALGFASHVVDAPTETDMFFIIDYKVPFFSMVLHGFIEFAGRPTNMRENYCPVESLLISMTTGAGPRYTLTAQPTRIAQFSPHERFYSTHYVNWMELAINHYRHFNEVFRELRGERMVGFHILAGRSEDIMTSRQVTVTEFSNGTRIYVNNTSETFEYGGVIIPPQWFTVTGGA